MNWLAYARLVRIPNVFTALADIALGGLVTGAFHTAPVALALLALASACLYSAGMVLNDIADLAEDTRDRPFRPLPSGAVSLTRAKLLTAGLFAGGLLASAAVSGYALAVAGALVVAIGLYDLWLKRTWFGPVSMALCRFGNVLLGLSAVRDVVPLAVELHLASVVGLYIVGVTWFAKQEATTSSIPVLRAAVGVVVAALVLALAVPMHWSAGHTSPLFPYCLVLFGLALTPGVQRALADPQPQPVQTAVKRLILGLVALDAVLAVALVGPLGLLILGLWLPARWLGRWVYST
jgi:4-hydroxybenzoate polyprenyltransferase